MKVPARAVSAAPYPETGCKDRFGDRAMRFKT